MSTLQKNSNSTEQSRPPVVVVLGHIDHGKTTLLDKIRSTNITARESGGITQHIGAYEVVWHDKKVTFLDTPGHETFSKMRSRGALVADIAILVVAADDGPKPQTIEALAAINESATPFVVALNKIDKPSADIDRVKSKLAEVGVLVEGWGGTVPVVEISAKEGRGLDELLETVFLLAELAELSSDFTLPGEGVVIESHLDSKRGPSATLLVTNGSVNKGLFIRVGKAYAPVRILEDTSGKAIDTAGPSTPIVIAGFSAVPVVGMQFHTYLSRAEAEGGTESVVPVAQEKDSSRAEIGVMIKADVAGSLEALMDEIKKLVPTEVPVKFFDGGVGEITEGDVKTMAASKTAYLVGFKTKARPAVLDLALRAGITLRMFDVIYEAIDWFKGEFAKSIPKKVEREDLGKLLVLKTFRATGAGRVIGGRVKSGRVPKDARFDVLRAGEKIFSGSISGLQHNKVAADELSEGEEGGLLVHVPKAIEERDTLVFFYEREA